MLTLTDARERVQQEESEENINEFFRTLKTYIENDKWVPIILKEGSNELETFNINGKWYFGIYSGEIDVAPKEFPTVVTGIKQLISIINRNDDVAGLLIDPIDGNCFFVDKELINECLDGGFE